ncbi:MAG: DctP family TRAP transporter solute-binding subunit [Bacteroidetes bacterium]|nr:DctP family TRAP transporter solute-binding subunit [Bacteroidota bacterium]
MKDKAINTIFKTKVYFLFFLFLSLIYVSSCKQSDKTRVLKLAHGLDANHPVHKGMVYMADRLTEKSGGEMKIQIYPSGQLGPERTCVELLQIGSLDITKVSAAVMEGFAPNYRVLGLPYIFRNSEHAHKVLDGEIGKDLLLEGEKFWLRGLCFYDAGSRSFYTKEKPIQTPDDLKGLKIRVMKSNTAVNMIKSFGGSPTPISWGELYTALQGGVVDGAENNPPSFYLSHHYEVCKFYSLNEHTSVPDVLLISTHTWRKLNDQEKKWLQEAADESIIEQRKFWEESVKEALEEVQKAGVKLLYPDKKPFSEKVQTMYDEYVSEKELYTYIKRIQAVK